MIKSELSLVPGFITVLIFSFFGTQMMADFSNVATTSVYFIWLMTIMLWASFSVVRHADMLAVKLGEPYGTLILTLSVISIEVAMISTIMLVGENNPTLGRDMMFSVIMIVLNGLVGIALIVGGLKHKEQNFNFRSANIYLTVLIPLAGIGMIMPNFTKTTEVGTYSTTQSIFEIGITLFLYIAFLVAQTRRHKKYFIYEESQDSDDHHGKPKSAAYHFLFLFLNMLIIVLLSKKLALIIDHSTTAMSAPAALGGVLVAILVLAPEGMAAIKSAQQNNLQRSLNITLGSAIATIGLTIPAILVIGMVTGNKVILGLESAEGFLLMLTFLVSIVNFTSGKSNLFQGLIHLSLFFVYLILVFD